MAAMNRTLTKKSLTVLVLALVLIHAPPVLAAKILIKVDALDGPPIRVFLTKPLHLEADRPIVFVMHGVNRNAVD